jgi:hypothetical protein
MTVLPGFLNMEGMRCLNARVAQSVERSAVNRKVGGSNPPVSDIFFPSFLCHELIILGKKDSLD